MPLGELGRGGLGKVALVRDRRLGREIAIKQLVHRSAASRARFLREAQLTAQLEHPAIVPVYDVGVDGDGEPFYAMRRVTGETLSQRVGTVTTAAERLALVPVVLAAAEAVAYAHERGIVHRDLKPSNILCGERGETTVIDWGLARRVGAPVEDLSSVPTAPTGSVDAGAAGPGETLSEAPDGASRDAASWDDDASPPDLRLDEMPPPEVDEANVVTLTGEIIGTPAYMPPEQAAGEVVDARADVYSLGATLYFVLSGAPPYVGASGQVLRRVVSEPPDELEERAPGVPGALAAIVRRAMAREPGQRYANAGELVTDLRRFLSGRLVAAHQYRPWSLAWWWLRRHRAAAVVAVGAALALAAGSVASVQRIRRERGAAEHARGVAQRERDAAAAGANRLRLLQARAELERDPTVAAAWLATYRVEAEQRELAMSVASAAAVSAAQDLLPVTGPTIQRVCVSTDGRAIVGIDRSGDVFLWDRATTPVAVRRVGSLAEPPSGCRISASGTRALVHGRKGALALVDLPGGAWTAQTLKVKRGAFAGEAVVLASADQKVYVMDPPRSAPRELGTSAFPVVWLAESPGGDAVAMTGQDGSLAVWTLDGKVRALPPHPRPLTSIDLLADGSVVGASSTQVRIDRPDGTSRTLAIDEGRDTVVVTAALRDSVLLIDSSSQRLQRWWFDGRVEVVAKEVVYDSLASSVDGARAAWATQDGVVHVFDAASGAERELRGHGSGVRDLVVSRDGETIVTTAEDASLRVWEPDPPDGPGLRGVPAPVTAMGANADRSVIVVGDEQGRLTIWRRAGALDQQVGEPLTTLGGKTDRVVVADRGDRALVGIGDDRLALVDLLRGTSIDLSRGTGVLALGFSAAGEAIALFDDRKVRAFDAAGAPRVLLEAKTPFVAGNLTPDGRIALVSAFDGVRVIELATGATARLVGPEGASFRIVPSPDSRRAIAVTGAGVVWRWSLDALPDGGDVQGEVVGQMRGNTTDVAISRDGAMVAVTDESGAIAVFNEGGAVRWLHGHDARSARLGFTPSGRLVSCDKRGLLRVWDPATGATGVVGELRATVRGLLVVGDTAVVSDDRGPPRVWHLDRAVLAPAEPAALETWIRARTRVRVDDHGAIATPLDAR
ncbi:MAG TPA: protein kinase [Kofleriaceae bacterium]|nr:protein kinase [Kofleriaceae bacterium]